MNKKTSRIIVIAPNTDRTKGGIASVVKGLLNGDSEKYGCKLHHINSHVEGNWLEKLFYFLKGSVQLMSQSNFQLVHIHTASGVSFLRKSLFVLMSKLRRTPVILHVHGADFDKFFLRFKIQKVYIKWILQMCNSIIVLSDFWRNFLKTQGIEENVVVIFNGVDYTHLQYCCTIPNNINTFLFLGRLGKRKGIYDLIDAAELLIYRYNFKNIKFMFAGDGEVEKVKNIIKERKLSQNIEVLGWIDDEMKTITLKKVDTVILPSYDEGLPVALLEGMAAGKVIISTAVGGIPDLIQININGYLITPGDIEALADRIKFVYEHPQKMISFSMANMKKIKTIYSISQTNSEIYKLYNRLLEAS